MTEEEARTKWCPFVRIGGHRSTYNRDEDGTVIDAALCVASSCMAWREDGAVREMDAAAVFRTIASGRCGLAD